MHLVYHHDMGLLSRTPTAAASKAVEVSENPSDLVLVVSTSGGLGSPAVPTQSKTSGPEEPKATPDWADPGSPLDLTMGPKPKAMSSPRKRCRTSDADTEEDDDQLIIEGTKALETGVIPTFLEHLNQTQQMFPFEEGPDVTTVLFSSGDRGVAGTSQTRMTVVESSWRTPGGE